MAHFDLQLFATDGHLNFDTKIDAKGFSSGIGKLGGIAKGGLAILGASVAGITTAFVGMSKAALGSVASLEQNVGGVETLFRDSTAKWEGDDLTRQRAMLVGGKCFLVTSVFPSGASATPTDKLLQLIDTKLEREHHEQ